MSHTFTRTRNALEMWLQEGQKGNHVRKINIDDDEKYNVDLTWMTQFANSEIEDNNNPAYIQLGVIGHGDTLDEAINDALDKYKQFLKVN